ncbi:MAG TPA: anaerobic ribonucleoside-triphosphate reductase activating protein [Candidatus Parcubacteria bacterium]|nr:anaerobic ribonucleoside-triphosphate reductase activating protein [Candidatus Parcubacteria bacterium]
MIIGGLEKLTLIDFPGKLACTVFLAGCNFRCPFCYSSELVLPEKIKKQPRISEEDFFKFLEERKNLLEGCVLLGGEPTLNRDLPEFAKKIKSSGYQVKLDTNGSNPEMLQQMIDDGLIDYVSMDIKAPKEKYDLVAGVKVDLGAIEKSIAVLEKGKVDYEFRTTVVPGLLAKEDIVEIAKWISGVKEKSGNKGSTQKRKYYLQNFKPTKTLDPKFENIQSYPDEYILEITKEVSPFFDECKARL